MSDVSAIVDQVLAAYPTRNPHFKLGVETCAKFVSGDLPTVAPRREERYAATPLPKADGKVGVVVLCHDAYVKYLDDCLAGFAAQTRKADELVVVHNGEKSALEVVERHKNAALHVVYVQHESRWMSRKRNDGFMLLRSPDFVVFFDSDDVPAPTYLADSLETLRDPRVSVAAPRFICTKPDGSYKDAAPKECIGDKELWELTKRNFVVSPCMMNADAFTAVGGWPEGFDRMPDWALWLRLTELGLTIKDSEAVFLRRMHHERMSARVEEGLAWAKRVSQKNEGVFLAIPFSGRYWAVGRTRDWLMSQTWPKENMAVLLLDASHDKTFHIGLRNLAADLLLTGYPTVTLETAGATLFERKQDWRPVDLADGDVNVRIEHKDLVCAAVFRNIAMIRRAANRHLTCILEDDVIPPEDGIRRLWTRLHDGADVASGLIRSRYSQENISYAYEDGRLERKTPGQVAGWGFVLMRTALLKKIVPRGYLEEPGRHIGVDYGAYRDWIIGGAECVVDAGCPCGHLTFDGKVLYPDGADDA